MSVVLKGHYGLDSCHEDVEVEARYAIKAVGGCEALHYLQLLVDCRTAVFDQQVHDDRGEVIRIELWWVF